MTLPPRLNARDFERAMAEFRTIVGKDWVFTDEAERKAWRDPMFPGDVSTLDLSAAVAPANVQEVQAIVKVANKFRIPLWPVSTGKNYAYGGANPAMKGTVVLDLKRMNRILEVNEEFGYALVEPGVTYFDLYNYVKARGLKLWIDCPSPGWASVVGNAMERGLGNTPYSDHAAQQCGMEVVLPTGELVRTGMGSIEGSPLWQLQKNPFGPTFDGMFMQSNMGIVTKMGIWLMPEPEVFVQCNIPLHQENSMAPMIDALRPLRLDGTIQNPATIRSWVGALMGQAIKAEIHDGPGAIPRNMIPQILKQRNLPWWNTGFSLYGHDDVVEASLKVVRKGIAHIPGAELKIRKSPGNNAPASSGTQAGVPSLAAFSSLNWPGGRGSHLDFSPVYAPTGAVAGSEYQYMRSLFERHGFDFPAMYSITTQRYMLCVTAIMFDAENRKQAEAAARLFKEAHAHLASIKCGLYRAHVAFGDLVQDNQAFNNNALRRLSERIKDTLDPQGILAPGKQGIWPKNFQANRT
jgi:4-cresol dehydrogenase (hydroxylating)